MLARWIRVCVCLSLILGFLFAAPFAIAETDGAFSYSLSEDGKATIDRYVGSAAEVAVPWNLSGHLVVAVGESAFEGNAKVRKVTLPAGVTVVRAYAFKDCAALTEIVLPKRLETLEDGVFLGCSSLREIAIPGGIFEIGEHCFEQGVTLISDAGGVAEGYARACSLAFSSASGTAPAPVQKDDSTKDYQYSVQGGKATITAYTGRDFDIHVPASIDGHPVVAIGSNAFSSCYNAERIVLPEGLTTLERTAFRFCLYLTEVELPSTLRTIGDYAFYKCEILPEIVIPDGVTTLGKRAFEGCTQLRDITLPASIQSIAKYTFFECHAQLTIHAPSGSAAHIFAGRNGYRFIATK